MSYYLSLIQNVSTEDILQVSGIPLATHGHREQFRKKHGELFPGFVFRLRVKCPHLTSNETLICCLIQLRSTNAEAATRLGISVSSFNTARYRIRKKLQLNKTQKLDEFIYHL